MSYDDARKAVKQQRTMKRFQSVFLGNQNGATSWLNSYVSGAKRIKDLAKNNYIWFPTIFNSHQNSSDFQLCFSMLYKTADVNSSSTVKSKKV